MNKGFLLLSGLGVGVGLTYLFDPTQGRRRRSRISSNVRRASHQAVGVMNHRAGRVWDHTRDAFGHVHAHVPSQTLQRFGLYERRSRRPDPALLLLGGLGIGASLLFLVGARKASQQDWASPKTLSQMWNWVSGLMSECGMRLRRTIGPDQHLASKVQAQVNRLVSRPNAIDIAANQGQVTLSGPVLAREYDDLMTSVASLHDVHEVVDRLDVQERTDTIMGVADRPIQ